MRERPCDPTMWPRTAAFPDQPVRPAAPQSTPHLAWCAIRSNRSTGALRCVAVPKGGCLAGPTVVPRVRAHVRPSASRSAEAPRMSTGKPFAVGRHKTPTHAPEPRQACLSAGVTGEFAQKLEWAEASLTGDRRGDAASDRGRPGAVEAPRAISGDVASRSHDHRAVIAGAHLTLHRADVALHASAWTPARSRSASRCCAASGSATAPTR